MEIVTDSTALARDDLLHIARTLRVVATALEAQALTLHERETANEEVSDGTD
jgi:hypothetical protein